MKTLYIECNMGIAGDMLTGALLDLLDGKERQEAIKKICSFAMDGVQINAEKDKSYSVTGTKFDVKIENCSSHHHTPMDEIYSVIDGYDMDEKTKSDAKAIYAMIADAESRVHGRDVTQIHLHELGMKDAIIDITSACYLINKFNARIICSPITTGYGSVNTAHGILSVPAPATAMLLKGIPITSGDIEGELCTPTGAAIVKYYALDFCRVRDTVISRIGVGFGSKDFGRLNCVRVFLTDESNTEQIEELRCQIDDMTGEEMGFALEKLIELGANDAYVKPIVMKKSRPAMELTVITTLEKCNQMAYQIFKHTTTIGIRRISCTRYVMDRHLEEKGAVHIKRCEFCDITKEKAEFDDLAKIAKEKNISLFEAKKLSQCY